MRAPQGKTPEEQPDAAETLLETGRISSVFPEGGMANGADVPELLPDPGDMRPVQGSTRPVQGSTWPAQGSTR